MMDEIERPAIVALASTGESGAQVVVATNAAARGLGLSAVVVAQVVAKALGGGAGGNAEIAQGGGKRTDNVADALALVAKEVAATVEMGTR